MPKYPHIGIRMPMRDEPDGNAYVILGAAARVMREENIPSEEINRFYKEATSGNYEHLRATVALWITTVED